LLVLSTLALLLLSTLALLLLSLACALTALLLAALALLATFVLILLTALILFVRHNVFSLEFLIQTDAVRSQADFSPTFTIPATFAHGAFFATVPDRALLTVPLEIHFLNPSRSAT
jgi:hypothetical protein